jgi:hypothetical protein
MKKENENISERIDDLKGEAIIKLTFLNLDYLINLDEYFLGKEIPNKKGFISELNNKNIKNDIYSEEIGNHRIYQF